LTKECDQLQELLVPYLASSLTCRFLLTQHDV
jgi:hypothetical protein